MRVAYFCIITAAAVVSFNSSSLTQSAAGKATVSPTDKPAPKYFKEIYTLPDYCLQVTTDSSNEQIIKKLQFSPMQRTPGVAPSCPDGSGKVPSTNAAAIADPKALGSDADYELDAVAPNKIVIYLRASKPPPAASRLADLKQAIDDLAGTDFGYAEIISVPAGQAKDIASKVSSLNSGGIIALPLDDDGSSILLRSKGNPDPKILADLKQRIFDLRWQVPVAPPTQRLFHLNATTVVKNLSGSADGGSEKPAAGQTASSKSGLAGGGGDSVTSTVSPTVSVTVTAPGAATSPDPTKTANAPGAPPSDAAKSSDSSAPSATKKPGAADAKSADTTPKPLGMQAVNDTLVYSNLDGTDRGIYERNRLMAVLDLPRPEVLLNMWALQASSRDYEVTNAEAEAVHSAVAENNKVLQDAIDDGWDYLSKEMKQATPHGFFNVEFYDYITQKFVFEWSPGLTDPHKKFPAPEDRRLQWGWCNRDTYCLGFANAFEPLRPTFTNILLAIIAANDPRHVAQGTIQHMEGDCPPSQVLPAAGPCPISDQTSTLSPYAAHESQVNDFRECLDTRIIDIETARQENGRDDCELADRLRLVEQLKSLSSEHPQHEHLQLNCFKRQSETSFGQDPGNQTTRVGLLRAAVADFLFDYKWATQYPHAFIPYDLSQSAQELNAELNPLILAFNRDVAAFTQAVQTEMQCKYNSIKNRSWFGRGDETFINDGMIAVRGISGVESLVDTVTQTFFDATKPPSLTDLVQSVSDAEQHLPGILKTNLSANEAAVLLGALNSVKPAEAKIGRQLKLDVTPHALAGASSAELDVKITAEEAGSPTFFTADKKAEDNLSRVATHDTTTKVRVDSLKLFDVSSFSAMLQRPRSKFPILPPLFEVPYFGSLISFPIPGAKVYHRSTAIISAVIVPTAADLAYGIDFAADRICEKASEEYGAAFGEPDDHYVCHRASSPSDFNGLPLRNYHKAVVQCLVSQQQTAYTGNQTIGEKVQRQTGNILMQEALTQSKEACHKLSFSTVPPD